MPGEWKRILQENQFELGTIEGNLLSAAGGNPAKTILVTSSRPGEGKTTGSMLVAQALASHAKARVLLVDGHLRSPAIHDLYQIAPEPGLADLIAGTSTFEQVIRPSEHRNLSLLPCGSNPSECADSLEASAFDVVLRDLATRSDYLVFDADSVLASSDGWVLGKFFDGVLLVVECERTKWEVVDTSREKISRAGGTVLGVILNKRKYYVPKALYGRL